MNRVLAIVIVAASTLVGLGVSLNSYSRDADDRIYTSAFWMPYTLDTRLHANVEAAFFPPLFPDEVIALLQQKYLLNTVSELPKLEAIRQVPNSHMVTVNIRAKDIESARGKFQEVLRDIDLAASAKAAIGRSQNSKSIEVVVRQIKELQMKSAPFFGSDTHQAEMIRLYKAKSLLIESVDSEPSPSVPASKDLTDTGLAITTKRGYVETGVAFGVLGGFVLTFAIAFLLKRVKLLKRT